jgi:hypothetical protein
MLGRAQADSIEVFFAQTANPPSGIISDSVAKGNVELGMEGFSPMKQ